MNATTDFHKPAVRRAAAVAATGALIVGLTGGIAAAEPDAQTTPTTPASELLLEQKDFPGGYWVVPSPQQRLANELGADPLTLVASAKVNPPECKNVLTAAKNGGGTDANTVAGVHDQDRKSLSESLVPKAADVDTLKVGLLKLCSDVTIEANDPKGGVVKVRAKTKEVASDKQKATFEIVIDGTRTKGTDSFPVQQKVLFGVASLRGYTVAVQGTKLGGDPDRGEFDSFFSKSVNKVKDAK
ncbi:hypothetical protein TPAU25S_03559 [Tsukamurella paurometabola]|uniref:DUF5642 domain-containing protein n=1 Tax=Tsukamurella paurometabola (strain ATCC 8368 / DSM 20162 / CCUG 35730 / CIP 100753 / JCM 10117 / KCTC 9821 / NBRC 16120 / NCIMB 702349 / NCTC 13040) TaxID=521096 RepID=D5UPV9_TSUPD|nr:hypothetical protein [Tsukamurella paurometabola]ADG76727.1 hypothetical protein Tpau_0073 [Tsukamurella paurometabola DSM 20162]SUP41376.1 Uncharacterised protein [Tsukamurella paurometabola]